MSNKALFLDRDGTLNRDSGYTHRIQDFCFLDYAVEGLEQFSLFGFKLFVVTNQSGIARGYYTMSDVERLHRWLSERLSKEGVIITEFLVCPHHPEISGQCNCRKPQNGLLEYAIERYVLDRSRSWMIGDRWSDQEASRRSDIRFIGISERGSTDEFVRPVDVVRNLVDAANIISHQLA